jgi:formate dehydrogenase iron-sulfur subunit
MANISERTLIDQLLESQRELTAAEKFARFHEENDHPAQAKYYRDLLPLSRPAAGQQYAFDVDLDRCSGCKACVTACHSLNGLAENETWRSVGSLHGGTAAAPFQATVTTACHHCVDPGCLNGCPVLAYEKDPVTGIVRHLDDQCIGCQYCVLKCPYEVPQYNPAIGIVRKCDMCSNRLAAGEAPACVQACPSEAIRITVIDKKEIAIATTTESRLVPGAPVSAITIPTTTFRTFRKMPDNTHAGDSSAAKPAQAHPPLVWMLILTQLSVGMFCFGWLNQSLIASFKTLFYSIALLVGSTGLIASVLHLGRPLQAWRSFLGWRRSWLSREILLFGAYISLAAALTVFQTTALLPIVVIMGLVAVFSSVMVYADTKRAFWSFRRSSFRFFGSVVALGLGAGITVTVNMLGTVPKELVALVLAVSAIRLSFDLKKSKVPELQRSSQLLWGELRSWTAVRYICVIFAGFVLPGVLLLGVTFPEPVALAAFTFRITAELLERHLFFTAVAPAKMPGGVA